MTYTDDTQTDYAVSASTAADWAWWDNRERRLTAELTHDMGHGWQLRSVLTHRRNTTDSELFYVFGTPQRDDRTGLFGYPSAFDGTYTQNLLNVQASGPFSLGGRRHDLVVGANWAKEKADEHSGYASYGGFRYTDLGASLSGWDGRFAKPAMDAAYDGSDFDSARRGLYGAARFSLADAVKLLTGAQWVSVRSSGANYGVAHAYDATRFTPYLGAVWEVRPTLSAYASYTRIYKPQTEADAAGMPLAPVEGSNAEVGLKADVLDRALSLQAAVFETRQNGLAGNPIWQGGRNVYEPQDTRSRGIELEATGRPVPGLEVAASLIHLQIHDANGEDARTFLPRDRATLSLRHDVTDRLRATAGLRWQSARSRDVGGVQVRQDALTLLDLGVSYRIDRNWKVSAMVRNVTDQKYINSLYWEQAYHARPPCPADGELDVLTPQRQTGPRASAAFLHVLALLAHPRLHARVHHAELDHAGGIRLTEAAAGPLDPLDRPRQIAQRGDGFGLGAHRPRKGWPQFAPEAASSVQLVASSG